MRHTLFRRHRPARHAAANLDRFYATDPQPLPEALPYDGRPAHAAGHNTTAQVWLGIYQADPESADRRPCWYKRRGWFGEECPGVHDLKFPLAGGGRGVVLRIIGENRFDVARAVIHQVAAVGHQVSLVLANAADVEHLWEPGLHDIATGTTLADALNDLDDLDERTRLLHQYSVDCIDDLPTEIRPPHRLVVLSVTDVADAAPAAPAARQRVLYRLRRAQRAGIEVVLLAATWRTRSDPWLLTRDANHLRSATPTIWRHDAGARYYAPASGFYDGVPVCPVSLPASPMPVGWTVDDIHLASSSGFTPREIAESGPVTGEMRAAWQMMAALLA